MVKGLEALLSVALMILFTLFSAWTGMILWNWFMPLLFELPVLTMAQALGVDIVVSWFTSKLHGGYGPKWTKEQQMRRAGYAVGTPLFLLAMGWILITFFM